jgi:hypothetical protein
MGVWLGYRGGGEKTMQTQEEIQLEQAQAESLRKKQCEHGGQRTAKP